ncbi:Branched-chain amino acid transport OS=Tsukamurella paurometabola (strain ATCC 8368 / DSM /CCUG 35730 / CIP 100753 / JCM 10117 / KCTC 9821 / NBRC 16120/ NCIMB 702349 / NCTC 13040) OX=521096 GN=Tpau_3186 PE=4 SV=1 [Tsukamurella paurometabola]|uniref:Branched-chain amino acid transport n=1 Tax=Tsukamurella paurometabola (strain ATCC 8368 / DSM 20162 / CCUG 35730 / CIP 100753 / JCM 10117 / KCTC 9821 / NBRC 16120 / NCIMB 702349 / NCTC 13040) TaxID=521096 RepID=D5UVJ1_TSUPD|nr:AzlD domain-containing protein [Tsukamurella paurometabola]ADG79773.1 branched-chain amino acid transport [Tsukamurella paurometabola DSM 20162]SUP37157.1 Predicted membrane protein [Tsukamurella paurometabola]
MTGILWAGAALAVVTLAFRAVGPVVAGRFELSPRARRIVDLCALALLAGVMATSAVADGRDFGGFARLAGVAVAGVLAWRRAPLPLVILAAGGTAAVLRLAGIE